MKKCALALLVMLGTPLSLANEPRDLTVFQAYDGYTPEVDFGSDVAIVYGARDFAGRAQRWRAHGYGVSMMTGISWGDYADYYGSGEQFKRDEVQTDASGKLFMHGNSTTVGYNVPTPAYVEYIKQYLEPAFEPGVQAIYLEEPEYWAATGWSNAFKEEWAKFYGEPWQAPDSSPDAQYRASKLKYVLYFDALKEVMRHIKQRAREKGLQIECHVPTHTLINYAHWGIVSPESHLVDIPDMDGYIAQVWTGTARTPNVYQGERKERTFETAFLEYGQAVAMVRPTGRKLWFLADPVEDNPNRSWNDYRHNYEATIIASLLWPEVHRYEVMPWPHRIFQGNYPRVDLDTSGGAREGIPEDYATQILTVISTLNDMQQEDVRYDTGTRGVGILVSDTMMFQRANPHRSDPDLGGFYGLALPLLKHGLPVEVVQLENVTHEQTLRPYHVLLLTYEGQKPLKTAYHDALADWVRGGGGLLFCEAGDDPYHQVREWWNEQGDKKRNAYEPLFELLGLPFAPTEAPVPVGQGYVHVIAENPSALQRHADGAEQVRAAVRLLLEQVGQRWEAQHYLRIDRGPYTIVSVLEESVSSAPLRLQGNFIDLMHPRLACFQETSLAPGARGLYYNLDHAPQAPEARVVAAAGRVRGEQLDGNRLRFQIRGPAHTTGAVRIRLPHPAHAVSLTPERPVEQLWDAASGTLLLVFEHQTEASLEVAF